MRSGGRRLCVRIFTAAICRGTLRIAGEQRLRGAEKELLQWYAGILLYPWIEPDLIYYFIFFFFFFSLNKSRSTVLVYYSFVESVLTGQSRVRVLKSFRPVQLIEFLICIWNCTRSVWDKRSNALGSDGTL